MFDKVSHGFTRFLGPLWWLSSHVFAVTHVMLLQFIALLFLRFTCWTVTGFSATCWLLSSLSPVGISTFSIIVVLMSYWKMLAESGGLVTQQSLLIYFESRTTDERSVKFSTAFCISPVVIIPELWAGAPMFVEAFTAGAPSLPFAPGDAHASDPTRTSHSKHANAGSTDIFRVKVSRWFWWNFQWQDQIYIYIYTYDCHVMLAM